MSKVSVGTKIAVLVAAAFILINPFTRRLVFWLLPLGRGIDDLIQLIVLVLLAGYLASTWWIRTDKVKFFRAMNRRKNLRTRQVLWAVAVLAALLLNPITGSSLSSLVLYGNVVDGGMTLFIGAVVTLIVVVGGWKVLEVVSKRS